MTEVLTPRRAAQKRLLRALGIGLSALSVLLVVSVFFLIVRTESAHDETGCPFSAGDTRSLGELSVREERRVCIDAVEERRYLVTRPGKPSYELARKRLPAARFAEYRWALRSDAEGMVLDMFVGDTLESEFHDADAVKR